jgi:hypothetical protein
VLGQSCAMCTVSAAARPAIVGVLIPCRFGRTVGTRGYSHGGVLEARAVLEVVKGRAIEAPACCLAGLIRLACLRRRRSLAFSRPRRGRRSKQRLRRSLWALSATNFGRHCE